MKDNSNRISVIVAIFAVILILGGVYLLNASFNSNTKDLKKSTSKSGMTYSVIDEGSEDQTDDTSKDLFGTPKIEEDTTNNSVTEPTETQKLELAKAQKAANEESALKKAEQEKQAKDAELAKKKKEEEEKLNKEKQQAPLANNQIVVNITSTDGYNSIASIVSCGIVSITACDSGEPLRIRALQQYTDISVGSKYRLTGQIYEYNGIIRLDTLSTVELVK